MACSFIDSGDGSATSLPQAQVLSFGFRPPRQRNSDTVWREPDRNPRLPGDDAPVTFDP